MIGKLSSSSSIFSIHPQSIVPVEVFGFSGWEVCQSLGENCDSSASLPHLSVHDSKFFI